MDAQSLPRLGGSGIPPNSETFFIAYRPQTQATQAIFNFILAFVAMKLDLSEAGEAALSDTELLSEYLTDEQLQILEELKDSEKELKELDEILGPDWRSREFHVPQECVYIITDVILDCLKNEYLEDFKMKEEIELTLGNSLSSEEFNELVALGNKITDYVMYEEDCGSDSGVSGEV